MSNLEHRRHSVANGYEISIAECNPHAIVFLNDPR